MVPAAFVRWSSVGLAFLFLIAARPRSRLFNPDASSVRTSRPLDAATGPLWVVLNVLSFIAFVFEAVGPGWVYEGPLTLHPLEAIPVQLLGLAAWSAGGALHWWAGREIGIHNRLRIGVGQGHRLITSGPYRRIRHPMYVAVLLMNAGAAVFLLNLVLLALVPPTYAVAVRRALLEEEVLASEAGLGETYREYARRTGRFVPRLWLGH